MKQSAVYISIHRSGKIRRVGHSESLHKFMVSLLQTSCSPSPPEPGHQIKEKVAGLQDVGRREEPGEPRIWRGSQDQACSVDRAKPPGIMVCATLASQLSLSQPQKTRLCFSTFKKEFLCFSTFNKGLPFITKNNLPPKPSRGSCMSSENGSAHSPGAKLYVLKSVG